MNDYKYGKCNVNNDELGLWCYKITITHPISKEKITFDLGIIEKYSNEFYNQWSYTNEHKQKNQNRRKLWS